MNDLVLLQEARASMPGLFRKFTEIVEILKNIESFEDIERIFLRGNGLSPNTYASYLTAVRQFYDFSGSIPIDVLPADIERFYDYLVQKVDRNTAYVRIEGLKRFFHSACQQLPWMDNPFDIM